MPKREPNVGPHTGDDATDRATATTDVLTRARTVWPGALGDYTAADEADIGHLERAVAYRGFDYAVDIADLDALMRRPGAKARERRRVRRLAGAMTRRRSKRVWDRLIHRLVNGSTS